MYCVVMCFIGYVQRSALSYCKRHSPLYDWKNKTLGIVVWNMNSLSNTPFTLGVTTSYDRKILGGLWESCGGC